MTISAHTAWTGTDAASRSGALDQRFALDVQGVDALRRTVRSAPDEGLKQVSRQFEALFMNMVLKSMREASPESGLLDSQSEKVYLSMLDQQLSQSLSGRGLGLAEAMLAQLRHTMAAGPGANDAEDDVAAMPLPPPIARRSTAAAAPAPERPAPRVAHGFRRGTGQCQPRPGRGLAESVGSHSLLMVEQSSNP